MSDTAPMCTLGMVLAELGAAGSLIGNSDTWLNRPVSRTVIWLPTLALPAAADVLIVCAEYPRDPATLSSLMNTSGDRMIVVPVPHGGATSRDLTALANRHAVVVLEGDDVDVSDIVTAFARANQSTEESVSRRLASLQRTLSQALSDDTPVEGIMARLKRLCNATIVVVDRAGESLHATGPVPLALLFAEISKTTAESQIVDTGGWRGVATRLVDVDASDEHLGWLVAVTRRQGFPDPYAMSAVHIGATLIEANRRMTIVARSQERAVRATVLEQAMAVRPQRHDPEIAGRMAGLGLSFTEELRAVATRPLRSTRRGRGSDVLETLANATAAALNAAAMPNLQTVREQSVVTVVQGDGPAISRALAGIGEVHVGIGRPISDVAGVADSYHDAQLAVRTLRRTSSQSAAMAFEDFDFATALFSEVGLDNMASRARRYLGAIIDRETLVEGLQAYFDHGQNIIAAAEDLNIHHNSLRYRLSKIETLLEVSLKDAGDIASVFLALTALDLSGLLTARSERLAARPADRTGRAADVAATGAATEYPTERGGLGVVVGGND